MYQPDTLIFDGYSGDYGPNFVGHALNVGTYIINHPDFGWQAFGGTISSSSNSDEVTVKTMDTLRRRIFIASFGTLLTLDAGAFSEISVDVSRKSFTVQVLPVADGAVDGASAPVGRLLVESTADIGVGSFKPSPGLDLDAGAYVVPFVKGKATVTFHNS